MLDQLGKNTAVITDTESVTREMDLQVLESGTALR